MEKYTEARLNDLELNQQFTKLHYREMIAILVSADKELCEKYLEENSIKLHKIQEAITAKEIRDILDVSEAQMSLITSQFRIYSLIENYVPFGQPPINPNKTSGRNLFFVRIQKENGEIFSKEMFDKHFKNYLTSIPCQQALEKAKIYLSEKVD